MAVRNLARSEEKLIYLIYQALDEVESLRATIEYDEEFMGNAQAAIEPLKRGLTHLIERERVVEDSLCRGNDFDFLHVLRNNDRRVSLLACTQTDSHHPHLDYQEQL